MKSKSILNKRISVTTGAATAALAAAAFANQADIAMPDTGGGYKAGQILFANDSRFLESYYSEPLTNYAVGWKDPNDIQATLNFIAPPVNVSRRFEWKKAVNAEEFLSEVTDDIRAIGSDFKRVDYQAQDVTDRTLNKGLTYIADLDNVPVVWQNAKVEKLLRRLYRNELRRALVALQAGAVNQNVTWSTGSTANPDNDILTALIAAASVSGIRPNRVMYGDTAFQNRHIAYENTAGTATAYGNIAAYTPDQLAARLMVDKVYVSRERYQSSASAKTELTGSNVYAWYAQDGVDIEDPSNLKRFFSSFDADQGGGPVRVFVQQISAKLVAITVEHYSKIVVTYTGGIRRWTVS